MRTVERIARVALGLTFALASAALFAAWREGGELPPRTGGLATAIVAAYGFAAGLWLLGTGLAGRFSGRSWQDDRITVYKSWALGVGWIAVFLPLAVASREQLLWYVTSVPIAFVIAMLVHEGGHAAAALALNARITAVQLGPLHYDRDARRFALARAPELGGGIWAADVMRSSVRAAVFFGAGPFVNLAFTVGCLVGSHHPVALELASTSALVAVANLVPVRRNRGGHQIDGRVLLNLVLERRAIAAERRILAEVVLGKRATEWSVSLEECLREAEPGSTLALLGFARAMDEGRIDIAERLLGEALAVSGLAGPIGRNWLLSGAMFQSLVHGNDELGVELLRRGRMIDPTQGRFDLLADAAIFVAQDKEQEAIATRARWIDHLKRSSVPSDEWGAHRWAWDELARRLGPTDLYDVSGKRI